MSIKKDIERDYWELFPSPEEIQQAEHIFAAAQLTHYKEPRDTLLRRAIIAVWIAGRRYQITADKKRKKALQEEKRRAKRSKEKAPTETVEA